MLNKRAVILKVGGTTNCDSQVRDKLKELKVSTDEVTISKEQVLSMVGEYRQLYDVVITVSDSRCVTEQCAALEGQAPHKVMHSGVNNIGTVFMVEGILDHNNSVLHDISAAIHARYSAVCNVRAAVEEVLAVFERSVRQAERAVVLSVSEVNGPCVKVWVEGRDADQVCDAHHLLITALGDRLCLPGEVNDVYLLAAGSTSFSKRVAAAIQVLEESLSRYTSDTELYVSFNGGKDCTVLLHLVWAVWSRLGHSVVNALYIRCDDPFEEVEHFIQSAADTYKLHLVTKSAPIRQALQDVTDEEGAKAVLMGTRRTDPYSSSLLPFQMCDAGWPAVMRINPLLEWSYRDIWLFIRLLAVPYCPLYDIGYTSLGSVTNTKPNPALKVDNTETYLAAYRLEDGTLERQGRTK